MPFVLKLIDKRQYNASMDGMSFMSADELQAVLGGQLKELRLAKNLDQVTTAERAGVSTRALRNLEAGRGSSVETLVRVLKALDSLDGLRLLAPRPVVSPVTLLRHAGKAPRRVRRRRTEERAE